MDTFNRVVLALLFALAAVASLVGILLLTGAITPEQVQSVLPYQQVADLFTENLTVAASLSIALLVVVFVLGVFWLRGQFAGPLRAMRGGEYEVETEGPGFTTVNYAVLARGIDNATRSIPGVVDSNTQIYADRYGQLFAQTSIVLKRGVDIHGVDEKIRETINQEWLDRLGSELARHDITVTIQPAERRVA